MNDEARKRADTYVTNSLRRIFSTVRYREYLDWRIAMVETAKFLERFKRSEPET
jgi:hypothetical protein